MFIYCITYAVYIPHPRPHHPTFIHASITMASTPPITPPYTITPLPSSHPAILPTFLSLFDESIAWLTSKGISAQWGSEPLKDDERHVRKVKTIIEVCLFFLSVAVPPGFQMGLFKRFSGFLKWFFGGVSAIENYLFTCEQRI